MRYEATVTCLSWIPPTAVEGVFSLPFGLGVAHYDQPPPDELPDVEALLAADAIRIANQLHAWIEVENGHVTSYGRSGGGRLGSTTVRMRSRGLSFAGVALPDLAPPPEVDRNRVRFTQTAGGHTGAPVPRAVPHRPFWRLAAPIAWSTIAPTLRADGSSAAEIAAASPGSRPGAIFDPSARTSYSKQHVTVRATTACRLAVMPRALLDSQALLGVAAEQRSRLDSLRADPGPPEGGS